MTKNKSLTDLTADAFTWAEQNLYGHVSNKKQIEYAVLTAEALEKGSQSRVADGLSGQLVVEGETGTGKTLGYLIPSMLHAAINGRRVVVSTYTLALQRQIMRDDGDFERANTIVKAMTGKTLTVATRVGRQNFVDIERVTMLAGEAGSDSARFDALMAIINWYSGTQTGDIREFVEADGEMPVGMIASDICLTSDSSDTASKFYDAHKLESLAADVILVTHAMLAISGLHGFKLLHDGDDKRKIGALIVDEADRFPGVAQNIVGNFISLWSLSNLALKAARIINIDATELDHAGQTLWKATSAAYVPGSERGIAFWDDLTHPQRDEITASMGAFLTISKKVGTALKKRMTTNGLSEKDRDLTQSFVAAMDELSGVIEMAKEAEKENGSSGIALRWSPSREWPSIKTFDLNPARILKRLWGAYVNKESSEVEKAADVDCLVLTSATISTPGKEKASFFNAINEFGIWEKHNPCADMHTSFMPEVFGNARFVFPDPSVPAPYIKNNDQNEDLQAEVNQEWLQYAFSMISAAHVKGGRALVLTGSFRTTAMLCDLLRQSGLAPIEHVRGMRLSEPSMLPAFRHDEKAILVSPSAWEGVDEKHLINHLIIAQLPFSSQDDVGLSALKRYLVTKGRTAKMIRNIISTDSTMSAIRRLKQGFGRGIRAHDDEFTFWVADPRFPAADVFEEDTSGKVPMRGTAKKFNQFHSAIPVRFRVHIGNPFNESSLLFRKDGKFVSATELLEEFA